LCWDRIGNFVIPIHVHILNLRNLGIRWWGRVVVCLIVIGRANVWWILHFTLHNYISHWLRDTLLMDAFLVVTGHIRVLAP
jgi:hypothetical protein